MTNKKYFLSKDKNILPNFNLFIRTNINGTAIADLQKAVDIGPTSLSLTNIGLTPRQLAPNIRVNAINQIGGFFKNFCKSFIKFTVKINFNHKCDHKLK